MTGKEVLFTVLKVAIMIGFTLNLGGLLTWADRRQSSMIQDRIGPNRAVIKIGKFELRVWGLLHTAADGVKFFFKEDFMPPRADRVLFSIAPMLAVASVLAMLAVVPFGDTLCIAQWKDVVPRSGVCSSDPASGAYAIELMIAPLAAGILYVFAVAGQGIIAAAMAGASSDNKFSLMGGLRAASQMVSYEVTLGLSLIAAMMLYGTVRLDVMVQWQAEHAWGIFAQPIAFVLFFAASVAESKRIPFDLPEAESELVSGYFTEYSGMKFGMFYLAEYMEVVTSSLLIVTIFLGGWALPFIHRDGVTVALGDHLLFHKDLPHALVIGLGVLGFFGKVVVTCLLQTFVRWSLPRFRYDQLMRLGWRILLPASLANIFVTGVVWLALENAGEGVAGSVKIAADVTQFVVALTVPLVVLRLIVGYFTPTSRGTWLVGSSATMAAGQGGTKASPMQA